MTTTRWLDDVSSRLYLCERHYKALFTHFPYFFLCFIIVAKEAFRMFRIEKKVVVEVSRAELRLMRESLLQLRNRLIEAGRYTDAVDDMLLRLLSV